MVYSFLLLFIQGKNLPLQQKTWKSYINRGRMPWKSYICLYNICENTIIILKNDDNMDNYYYLCIE